MAYNLTDIEAANTTFQLLTSLSSISGGDLIGTVILIVIFGVIFINQKFYHMTRDSLMNASVITLVFAIIFRVLGLTGDLITFIFFFMSIGLILLDRFTD